MPILTTVPVFMCRGGCGQYLVAATAVQAITHEYLDAIVDNLHKIAVCPECMKLREYRILNPGAVPFHLKKDTHNDKRLTINQIDGAFDLEKFRQGAPQEKD